MIQGLVAVLLAISGAVLGGASGFGFTALMRRGVDGQLDMWRRGAAFGSTAGDRAFASSQAELNSDLAKWILPIVIWGFRIGFAVIGAGLGFALSQKVGPCA
jgi:hypothetical protein